MASFLLDVPYQLGRDVNTYFPAYRQWEFFAFGGDKWQVSPKLTVDLGLRWEFYPPATPQFPGGFSNYDPTNNTLVQAGIGGNPSNLGMKTRYNYFAPRVGLAYRLTEKTVIRAGFGMSYTPFPDNTYAYNYPVRSNNFYHQRGQRLRRGAASQRSARDLPAGLPAAGAGDDSLQRNHSGHRFAVEPELRRDQPQFQEPVHGDLEPGGATIPAPDIGYWTSRTWEFTAWTRSRHGI